MDIIHEYKNKVESEVESICGEIINTLEDFLVPKAENAESEVFYLKMKGDYCRYMAECVAGEKNKRAQDSAKEAYKRAQERAETLATTNPIRLGLALNYSVFFYEILNQPDEACKLAKTTFDSAISDLEKLDDDKYKDSATIMQLLRDNLTLWTADANEEGGDKEL